MHSGLGGEQHNLCRCGVWPTANQGSTPALNAVSLLLIAVSAVFGLISLMLQKKT